MRVRIKFTRNGFVKYLGHLDIMRTFQRCFNRAQIRMIYSEGFNPHQKLQFALPLGVGVLSRGEYLDAEVEDGQDPSGIRESLNRVSGDGFEILDVRILEEQAGNAMASVRFASYEIEFKTPISLDPVRYLEPEQILLQKKTKTGIREVDVKQLIRKMEMNGRILSMTLGSGGENSIKPELIAADLLRQSGLSAEATEMEVTRCDLYAEGMIPLIEYQTKTHE
ncbi:MAG: DUF2344 domain-containing protein [Parasporobacterium sp.]|nr:DUF2344 domain-containing protein [Parasporobacterium sp.]